MKKMILLGTLIYSFPNATLLGTQGDNGSQGAPITNNTIAMDEYTNFDHYVNTAFDRGVYAQPIKLTKPSFFKRLLTKLFLPLAMKLAAAKRAVQNWWHAKKVR